ncbi:SDR family NAD(P)-dependent oxidoreductase [Corynebacterium glucuronolyticum]|uniref:SDR family NAD(P)-dependent oxidoreductase n=1 Tax=Corynebacterium glucuronolyticum TaxID=39791 RepID=UPI00223B8DC8|nr:SDR family NAD(P)-dependent oxidoreductase [Corynebacterium glucuronolyticum]MCT1563032.1 SDR family NAD(P)-dependent oxidoreductase [Corynebacterium glucuronolyticum]
MRILITGASSGIGKSAAEKLRAQGHEIIGIGRREIDDPNYYSCDFTDFGAVRSLASELSGIDAMACNAGGILPAGGLTDDGFDPAWQTNVLANFLLQEALQPRGPVIWTSSIAQYGGPAIVPEEVHGDRAGAKDFDVYAQCKRGCALIARESARRGLRAASFHPGVISSNFGLATDNQVRDLYALPLAKKVLATPDLGGSRLAELLSGDITLDGSFYVTRVAGHFVRGHARDTNIARTIYEQSLEFCG